MHHIYLYCIHSVLGFAWKSVATHVFDGLVYVTALFYCTGLSSLKEPRCFSLATKNCTKKPGVFWTNWHFEPKNRPIFQRNIIKTVHLHWCLRQLVLLKKLSIPGINRAKACHDSLNVVGRNLGSEVIGISGWFHPNKNPMEITIDPNHLLISNWPSAHFAFGRLGNFPRFHEDDWNHLVFPTFSPSFPQVPSSFRPFTAAKKKKRL